MRPRTLEPVRLYCVVVALAGAAVLATLIAGAPIDFEGPNGILEFVALALCVLIGELFLGKLGETVVSVA